MKKIAYILFILSAIVFMIAHAFDNQIISSITKPIPLIILIFLVARDSRYNKLIIMGFIFSLAGDILLMETIDQFIFGLVAFLIAHVFYIFAFIKKSNKPALLSSVPFYIYGILFFWFLRNSLGDMAIPVAVYMLVITTMLWRSFVQRNVGYLEKWAMWGALLFTVSDSMIAISKFYESFYLASTLIMLAYWGGQFMIYWSTLSKNKP